METGENSVQNCIEKNSNGLTNNNSIRINCSPAADDAFEDPAIQKDNGFADSIESKNTINTQKPSVFDLIGGNENCDSEASDCQKKTILNNNDLAIGFVDDDDETNVEHEVGAANSGDNKSHETLKGHENNIG